MRLRLSEENEVMGADEGEVGEFAYDYVELTRDVVYGVGPADEMGQRWSGGAKMSGSIGSEKEMVNLNVNHRLDAYGGRRGSE